MGWMQGGGLLAGALTGVLIGSLAFIPLHDKPNFVVRGLVATLAISLALMGVTALTKRWWLFFVSLVPAAFGFYMGIAGFLGINTDVGPIKALIRLLS